MPNKSTPKAAPSARDNRGASISSHAAGAAATSPAASGWSPDQAPGSSLLNAIAAYSDGLDKFGSISEADYDRLGGEDAVVAETYGNAMDVLGNWQGAATSETEAIAALRMVQYENGDWDDTTAEGRLSSAMLRSVLSYFEDRAARSALSLAPSENMAFALKALSFAEARKDELSEQIGVFHQDGLENRFKGDFASFQNWAKQTEYPFICEQHEALCDLGIAVEKFIRATACRTIGDLVAKVQLNTYWMKDDLASNFEDYGEEACILMRSIRPLVEALGTEKAS